MRTESRYLRHDFTDVELSSMGRELAQVHKRVATLTKEKEDVVSAIKAKVTAAENRAANLAQSLNEGYEMRPTECTVEFHKPNDGFKTITRTDTGEIVDVEKMDAHEMQEQLPLQPEDDDDEDDEEEEQTAVLA